MKLSQTSESIPQPIPVDLGKQSILVLRRCWTSSHGPMGSSLSLSGLRFDHMSRHVAARNVLARALCAHTKGTLCGVPEFCQRRCLHASSSMSMCPYEQKPKLHRCHRRGQTYDLACCQTILPIALHAVGWPRADCWRV